jgi:hypothetical protein
MKRKIVNLKVRQNPEKLTWTWETSWIQSKLDKWKCLDWTFRISGKNNLIASLSQRWNDSCASLWILFYKMYNCVTRFNTICFYYYSGCCLMGSRISENGINLGKSHFLKLVSLSGKGILDNVIIRL